MHDFETPKEGNNLVTEEKSSSSNIKYGKNKNVEVR